MSKKKKQPQFEIHVKADVFFSAMINADNLEDAIQKAKELGYSGLWDATGDIIDTEHKITGVFES